MSPTLRSTLLFAAVSLPVAANAGGPGESPPEESPALVHGPLRVHPENPRYFADGEGRAVYLTGSHTWSNLVDIGPGDPPPAFDFDAYLDWMEEYGHNFIRLWTWELTKWDTRNNSPGSRKASVHTVAPHPWSRSGPGRALDGKPKFDLESYDPAYFRRLRARVVAARDRGIYVSVMLFEGWGLQFVPGAWKSHPFHPENNVNGIDGDADGDGKGLEVHTLSDPDVTALQEAYVREVVDTVNDLDNVLYEISNENHPASTAWQEHMIELIHEYEEEEKDEQHPVGMTYQYRGGSNETLFRSPADWISPNPEGGYRDDPPAADGRKVIITDTDHLWGIGGNAAWVWKSFLRGHNPIFMDPYDGVVLGEAFASRWDPVREALGATRRYARRLDLARMRPHGSLASTGYCLADPGRAYLVYCPRGGKVTVDLSAAGGELSTEWFHPGSGETERAGPTGAGGERELEAPFSGSAVLYLRDPETADAGSASETEDVLFSCGFESADWREAWSLYRDDGRCRTVAADPEPGFEPLRGKALRVRVDAGGHYGASLLYKLREETGEEPEAIYFRYYLRFANDWDPRRGGKLPGISGTYGRAGWGGRPSNGRNGWSARGLFGGQEGGTTPVGFYCYHADMRGRYGSHWEWDREGRGRLQNDRWYAIEQHARMNTPGENDGVLRAWVDGELAFEKTDVRMRDVERLAIEAIWINVYLGGRWTARTAHHLYIDEVAISRAPIGLLDGEGR